MEGEDEREKDREESESQEQNIKRADEKIRGVVPFLALPPSPGVQALICEGMAEETPPSPQVKPYSFFVPQV